jgi:hypothetical protein
MAMAISKRDDVTFPWSLGDTIRNVTPQNFETHPTLKQHMIHLKKYFNFKFYMKTLPKSCKIWNFNWIYKKIMLIFQMSGQRNSFRKVTVGFLCTKTQNECVFPHFFNDFNF